MPAFVSSYEPMRTSSSFGTERVRLSIVAPSGPVTLKPNSPDPPFAYLPIQSSFGGGLGELAKVQVTVSPAARSIDLPLSPRSWVLDVPLAESQEMRRLQPWGTSSFTSQSNPVSALAPRTNSIDWPLRSENAPPGLKETLPPNPKVMSGADRSGTAFLMTMTPAFGGGLTRYV